MEKINLSAPWITYYRELNEFFKEDKDVTVKFNEDENKIILYVEKHEKANALSKIIPEEKKFGNVVLKIEVRYSNNNIESLEEIYAAAFENNPAFKYAYTFNTDTNPITYVVFEKKVVQFWNDDMSDPHGVTSTLFENIAPEVFKNTPGVTYSTDSGEPEYMLNNLNPNYKKFEATENEVKEWEKYNGKGSFYDGSSLDPTYKPVKVVNERIFKSIFKK